VILTEFPDGNVTNAHVYSQSVFVRGDTRPRLVTLTTAYVSRHPLPGKADIVATVSGLAVPVIFYNTGSGFTTEARVNRHTLLSAWIIGLPCAVLVLFLLMACLWEYRVCASLLALLFVVVAVFVRGALTEQNLCLYRFNHTEETPLDCYGEPRLWRPERMVKEHICGYT
jgi:hypothetical protein